MLFANLTVSASFFSVFCFGITDSVRKSFFSNSRKAVLYSSTRYSNFPLTSSASKFVVTRWSANISFYSFTHFCSVESSMSTSYNLRNNLSFRDENLLVSLTLVEICYSMIIWCLIWANLALGILNLLSLLVCYTLLRNLIYVVV